MNIRPATPEERDRVLREYMRNLGKKGGASTSEAKRKASQRNGKLRWARWKKGPAK